MSWLVIALAIIGGFAVLLALGVFIISLSELYKRVDDLEREKEHNLKRLYDIEQIQKVQSARIAKIEGVV
jgi:hypothetical protein